MKINMCMHIILYLHHSVTHELVQHTRTHNASSRLTSRTCVQYCQISNDNARSQ